jgi:hypothetical protein
MSERYERPLRSKPTNQEMRSRKEGNLEKFSSISEMKTQHNAIQTLYKNGYDKSSLRQIACEFQDSIQFALNQVNSMRDNMNEIIHNTDN